MYFDVRAALLEIEGGTPANLANPANQIPSSEEKASRLAEIAELAAPQPQNQKSAEVIILDAVRAGNWSPGMVARASRLGVTKAYQEIEKLRRDGKLHQADGGILTIVGSSKNDI